VIKQKSKEEVFIIEKVQ